MDREMILLLGGGRALLMQIAHPKIAEGVADHSRFRKDPIGRLYETMNTMWSIVFDEIPEAEASLQRIKQIHRRVQGVIKQGDVLRAGIPYDAQDPDLLLWVHATLVDSAMVTYELFVGPLSVQDKRQYYDETKKLALLFEVPEAKTPASLEAFNDYMSEMIGSDAISVGSAARAIAKEILTPRPLLLKLGGPLSALITVGLLPPKLRREYGLTWNKGKERVLQLVAASIRTLLPFVPPVLRIVPHARAAQGRAAPFFGRDRIQAARSRR
ncbi:MAG: oxygenase MpaB family protein [Candidatus Binatia bacterium]